MNRVVALDFGLKRIGVAISDPLKKIAFPLFVFPSSKRSQDTVKALIAALKKEEKEKGYTVSEIVVGLPLLLNGKTGFLADEVHHFISLLEKESAIPIIPFDERLTSIQAERSLRESSLTRKKRTQHVDKIAATLLLQCYLDTLTQKEFHEPSL